MKDDRHHWGIWPRIALAVLVVVLAIWPVIVGAATAGPAFPGTAGQDGTGTSWVNVDNIKGIGVPTDTAASVTLAQFAQSKYLRASNFGFSIPSGATIDDVKVEINRKGSASNKVTETEGRLVDDGGVSGDDKIGSTFLPTTAATLSLNGDGDYWGFSLTPAVVNDTDFGFRYRVDHGDPLDSSSFTAYVYWVRITVTYTINTPTAILEATSGIQSTSATVNGKISDDGGANCQARFRHAEVLQKDDFEWGSDGDSVTDSGGDITWTLIGVETGSYGQISDTQVYGGTRSCELYRNNAGDLHMRMLYTVPSGGGFRYRMWKGGAARHLIRHGNGTYLIYADVTTGERIRYYNGSTWTDTGVNVPADGWCLFEIRNVNWTTGAYDIYLDNDLVANAQAWTINSQNNQINIGNADGQDHIYFDNIEVLEGWTLSDWQPATATLSTDSTYSKELTGLTGGTDYVVETQAKNSAGEGDWSASGYFTTVEITVDKDNYDFGTLAVGGDAATGLDYFTITNTGSVTVDITIQGTDLTGGDDTWTLSDSGTPGENIYALKAGLDGGDYTIIVKKSATYNTLKSGLAASATQDWGLKLWMPTSLDGYDNQQMSATVTLVASASS